MRNHVWVSIAVQQHRANRALLVQTIIDVLLLLIRKSSQTKGIWDSWASKPLTRIRLELHITVKQGINHKIPEKLIKIPTLSALAYEAPSSNSLGYVMAMDTTEKGLVDTSRIDFQAYCHKTTICFLITNKRWAHPYANCLTISWTVE